MTPIGQGNAFCDQRAALGQEGEGTSAAGCWVLSKPRMPGPGHSGPEKIRRGPEGCEFSKDSVPKRVRLGGTHQEVL